MRTFEDAEQALAENLPGYESREPQQRLARAVEAVFANPDNFPSTEAREEVAEQGGRWQYRHLLSQAGCGTGKSLGYLIPAILSATHNRRRFVVSVTTKALQDQLCNKDLPFLQQHLGVKFRWAVLKGRGNYFCVNRANTCEETEAPNLARALKFVRENPDTDGLRESFPFEFNHSEWAKMASETDECNALNCTDETNVGGCYASQARARARKADVIVVNHALLFTDLSIKAATGAWEAGLLAAYDAVILDEAHEVEEIAGNTLGFNVSEGTFRSLANEVRAWSRRHIEDGEDIFREPLARTARATIALFEAVEPGRLLVGHLNTLAPQLGETFDALNQLATVLYDNPVRSYSPEPAKGKQRRDNLRRRTANLIDRFRQIISDSFDDTVRWVEVERKRSGETHKVVKVAPINVAPFLREHLFGNVPVVLTSATMMSNGSFAYMAERLGIDTYDSLDVGTPFDFAVQGRMYVPAHLPAPTGSSRGAWEVQAIEEMVDLIKASQGRALILFTSIKDMKAAYASISPRVPYPVRMQGQAPTKDLAAWFEATNDGVLFGTKSFFTGVDFQGDTCSLVVISKMPFPVPDEPLFEARCEALQRNGTDPFFNLTIPVMSLTLQQAAGRLIRHRGDVGVVAILDPRLKTKGYGKVIVRDLPPMTPTDSITEVQEFFGTPVEAKPTMAAL